MEKLLKIIEHYGVSPQLKKLSEEIFEFQEAVLFFEEHKDVEVCQFFKEHDHIMEELADCLVILLQFKERYEISEEELERWINFKINRTLERIEKEKETKNERKIN